MQKNIKYILNLIIILCGILFLCKTIPFYTMLALILFISAIESAFGIYENYKNNKNIGNFINLLFFIISLSTSIYLFFFL